MEFGVQFFPSVGPDRKSAAQYWDEALHLTRRAEQLRRRRPGLKVLFTSGYAHDAMSGEAAGAAQVTHLLGKPYRRRDLALKVREVLDEPPAP